MGARPHTAWRIVYGGRKALWALSHSGPVDHVLDKAYFAKPGLFSLAREYRVLHVVIASAQLELPLE
jgi:hypothetical protein